MTDPYNTWKNFAPPARAATMASEREWKSNPIINLNVSDTWKKRFRLIEKAGGEKMTKLRELSKSERREINFNPWAFLIGPIYYLAKGLWRQVIVYMAAAVAITVVMDRLGFRGNGIPLSIAFGMFYAMRANPSYYQLRVLGKAPWV